MTWWSFLQLPTIYLKLVVLFGAFQMTTHLWLSIVANGGPLKIDGATGDTAWQVIASIESRWYGKTHATFALHWVPASVVTTRACRKMSAAMVTSGKFLWGSRSAVSLATGSAVGKKGCFLVLRKLLFVSFCVVVWVLFSVFSIFCITSLVSATPRNHRKKGKKRGETAKDKNNN